MTLPRPLPRGELQQLTIKRMANIKGKCKEHACIKLLVFTHLTIHQRKHIYTVHSHPAILGDQSPKNLFETASNPGQQVRLGCKEIQSLLIFVRGSERQRAIGIIEIRDSRV